MSWLREFGLLGARGNVAVGGGLESAVDGGADPEQRVEFAHANMRERVLDALGSDEEMVAGIEEIARGARAAVRDLKGGDDDPDERGFAALEAIVAFDGSRPSFLIRNDQVDLKSSWSTSRWDMWIGTRAAALAATAACVGRVEMGRRHIGTAFLVAPRLALTNRHVAQAIADFDDKTAAIHADVFLDFGREHRGRVSHDRRAVTAVVAAGALAIEGEMDHARLDIALLSLTASTREGAAANRAIPLRGLAAEVSEGAVVAAIGYPGHWRQAAPNDVRDRYGRVIARLMRGEHGAKRLAPGLAGPMLQPPASEPVSTMTHDATTIAGNSGSPLLLPGPAGSVSLAGIHYGGRWGGEGANWAHLLAACVDARCFPNGARFQDILNENGVAFP